MKKIVKIGAIIVVAALAFLFGRGSVTSYSATPEAVDITPEVCEVVAHNLVVRSPRGSINVAIVKRGNGELRSIYLVNVRDRTALPFINIPDDAHYAYICGLAKDAQPTSVVPIFDK